MCVSWASASRVAQSKTEAARRERSWRRMEPWFLERVQLGSASGEARASLANQEKQCCRESRCETSPAARSERRARCATWRERAVEGSAFDFLAGGQHDATRAPSGGRARASRAALGIGAAGDALPVRANEVRALRGCRAGAARS